MRYALLLTLLAAAAVSAQQPAPKQSKPYLVIVYLSLNQRGFAYVMGPLESTPLDAGSCAYLANRFRTDPPSFVEDIPPDEQLQVAACFTKDPLPGALYSWGCSAVEAADVPKMHGVKMWRYRCFRG